MRVLRIYHEGRNPAHRERDRALAAAGAELTLVVPDRWPAADDVGPEPFEIVALPVHRPGDVNRHRYADPAALAALIARRRPDVVDVHEEPFSNVTRQVLRHVPDDQVVVGYTAQNLDKLFPPPFAQWERAALRRLRGLYPCSTQAAEVVRGKGFRGAVRVLPLAAGAAFTAGDAAPDEPFRLVFTGRLVAEKGVLDAVRVAAALPTGTRLTVIGDGPLAAEADALAAELGVAYERHGWTAPDELAAHLRGAHVLLAPSVRTDTWAEQFGRMAVEAQACGAVVAGYASGALPEAAGPAGVLVPEGDLAALTAAVAALARDPARRRALRAEGLATAPTWASVARGQLELYAAARDTIPVRRPVRRRTVDEPPRFALPVLRRDLAVTRAAARLVTVRRGPVTTRDPLRVVFLDHVARLSGGEIALARLVAALPDDIEAHVILGEAGPLEAHLTRAGAIVEVLALDARARDTPRTAGAGALAAIGTTAAYAARLAARLRVLRPDLVHANSLKSGVYGAAAAGLAGVPLVWHLRDRLADDYLPARAAAGVRALLRTRAALVAYNSAETARCAGVAGLVVPDPLDPPPPVRRVPHDGLVVGLIGRIAPWKGQEVLLRALARLPADTSVRLVGAPLFGETDTLAALHRLAGELGVADRVTFTGFVDDVPAEHARLDVLVHASTTPEPFGQVVLEGMAAGLPVVAAAAGGPVELITDGVDGLLVTPGDVAALTEALLRLRDPALRACLGTTAQVRPTAFAPPLVGELVARAYRAVLDRA